MCLCQLLTSNIYNTFNLRNKKTKKIPVLLISILMHMTILQHLQAMNMRAQDHYISSTLIGGKGGAGPSSLHITVEKPTKYVNTRWI